MEKYNIEAKTDLTIEKLIKDAQEENGIKYGDITPRQQIKLEQISKDLSQLINELIKKP